MREVELGEPQEQFLQLTLEDDYEYQYRRWIEFQEREKGQKENSRVVEIEI